MLTESENISKFLEDVKKANEEARSLAIEDTAQFALKNGSKYPSSFLQNILEQATILKKLKSKIPSWAKNKHVLGFNLKAIEQCSTIETSQEKFKEFTGKNAIDLTAGFGVDVYALSQQFETVTHNELNPHLSAIAAHNFSMLGQKNVIFSNAKAEMYLQENKQKYDLIYLDPDRRTTNNQKLFKIEDCEPNVLEIQNDLLNIANIVIYKFSPILDINKAILQLKGVFQIKIIALEGEVKELVFYCQHTIETQQEVDLEAINILKNDIHRFKCIWSKNAYDDVKYSPPLAYIYEPSAPLMKSAQWRAIQEKFGIQKFAANSHFYTSSDLIENFHGRVFKLEQQHEFSKKKMNAYKNGKFNVISRNFDLTVKDIRKKYQIKEGKNNFLIFTSDQNGDKMVLNCSRIINHPKK